MNNSDRDSIAQWVEKQLDDALTEEEFEELQRVLTDQPDARDLYLDLMQQHAQLCTDGVRLSTIGVGTPTSVDGLQDTPPRSLHRGALVIAGIAIVASVMLMTWWSLRGKSSNASLVARIADSSDAEWGNCTLPTAIGSDLIRGRLRIERGLATIRFVSGAELTLESPAELEIQSPLRCRLISGTAVVEVPESAYGFTLSTPTAVAIDHGTAFAVSVDHTSRASSIEVLDGEVEVQHVGSDASRHLTQQQRVVASTEGLGVSDDSSAEVELSGLEDSPFNDASLHRITTADGKGRDSSISRGQSDDILENSRAELVLIKNPFDGYERFSRKGYFAFDLGLLNGRAITAAKFVLTLRPSGLGFASKVGDCEFVVYGLTDESGDDWTAQQLTWQTAPANLNGPAELDADRSRELGRFVIQRGRQHGQVSVDGNELVNFLNADTNGVATLIVVRATRENDAGGLVHGFANRQNSFAAPPTLLLNIETDLDK